MNKFSIFILLTLIFKFSFAQDKIFYDKIYQDSIKTVKLSASDSYFNYPIIDLNSDDKLILSFDDLDSENQVFDYYYTFIHCNADWTKSELYFEDYCDGFEDNQIYDYDNSFNTLQDYVNYQVEFPNDDINFLKSGNYMVMIYKNGEQTDTVLTKRFCISENSAVIDGIVKISSLAAMRETNQELKFTVKSSEFEKTNPMQYLSVYVYQNNIPQSVKADIKPRFVNGTELIFDDPFQNSFFGGNEFRYFDAKNIRFTSEKVADVELIDDYYTFFLVQEAEKKRYLFHKDFNGRYAIQNDLGNDPNSDADYIYVYFSFPREYPYPGNDVYIFGELSNWDFIQEYKMRYNAERKVYESVLFLKQGYYNYQFKLKNESEFTKIDGNFYETENDYVIYVYLKDFSYNYDRLIGTKVIGN